MPSIGIAAGVPGTPVGVQVAASRQSPSEKQADAATSISEAAERDRVADTSVRLGDGKLDRIAASDGLDRFR